MSESVLFPADASRGTRGKRWAQILHSTSQTSAINEWYRETRRKDEHGKQNWILSY